MSVINRISRYFEDSGPNTYRCRECGREFEVDAPPERAYCMECSTGDVELIDSG